MEPPNYKSTKRILDELIDIVSKNGSMILNITPRADGTIPEAVQERLLAVGRWLKLNGEAIYNTRVWTTYGEGPTQVTAGHFGEAKIPDFTAQDIRFTTAGKTLFAIVCGWPEDGQVLIRSLRAGQSLPGGEVHQVSLIGSDAPLSWTRSAEGLAVKLPAEPPCEHAVVLKIE